MKCLPLIALLAILSGCARVDIVTAAGRGVTDRLISRAGAAADRAMAALDSAEDVVAARLVRIRSARCLLPFPAIRRYAARAPGNRQTIARDCNLIIGTDSIAASRVE